MNLERLTLVVNRIAAGVTPHRSILVFTSIANKMAAHIILLRQMVSAMVRIVAPLLVQQADPLCRGGLLHAK